MSMTGKTKWALMPPAPDGPHAVIANILVHLRVIRAGIGIFRIRQCCCLKKRESQGYNKWIPREH